VTRPVVVKCGGAVAESAAVGVPDEIKGEAIWCFVVTGPDRPGDEALAKELSDLVATRLGKSFKPSRVVFVDELPKTRSAKIVRRALRAVVMKQDAGDLSSLENPSALDAIRERI